MRDDAGDRTATAAPAPAPATDQRLADGAQVTDRYKIVRFLAKGGMGEVYEADDRVLGDRVALKTLRNDGSAAAIERFRREVLLARRVTHPNVCRIHDVGNDGALLFLTMELLGGETLSDRLAAGALTTETAGRLARGMIAALAAAHAANVVHRDFKASNVMLVGDRVVVTDFGLARSALAGADEALTAERAVLGTPAYMAPEQVQGLPAGPPADIYALGVVLFEMVTGRRPFTGENAMVAATRRLLEPAPDPAAFVPGLPAAWRSTIAKCLEREPADRFAKVTDLIEALALDPAASTRSNELAHQSTVAPAAEDRSPPTKSERPASKKPELAHESTVSPADETRSLPTKSERPAEPIAHESTVAPPTTTSGDRPATSPAPGAVPARSNRRAIAAVGALAVAGAIAFAWSRRGGEPDVAPLIASGSGSTASGSAPAPTPEVRPAIAVIAIDDTEHGPEHAWIGNALSELLVLELSTGKLRAVTNDRVASALAGRSLPLDAAARRQVATGLGARYLATGALAFKGGDALHLELAVHDGAAATTYQFDGTVADLVGLAHRAGDGVLAKLTGVAPRPEVAGSRASLPKNASAVRLYVEGVAARRRFDLAVARKKLEAAITIEPEFPLSHRELGLVFQQLGEETLFKESAKRAWELAGQLPREEKLLVEADYRKAIHEDERALEIFRALRELYPDEIDHGIGYIDLLHGREARTAAYAELRAISDDPVIDAEEGYNLAFFDMPKGVALMERAAERAGTRGMRVLRARVLVDLAQRRVLLGRQEEARAGLEEARRTYEQIGDRTALAAAINAEGDDLMTDGRLGDAIERYREQFRIGTAVGSRHEIINSQCSIGLTSAFRGDAATARSELEICVDLMGKWKPHRLDIARVWHAAFDLRIGDLARVDAIYADLKLDGFDTATVAWLRGDLTKTRTVVEAGIKTNTRSGDIGELRELESLAARVELDAGNLAGCNEHAGRALAPRADAKLPVIEANAHVSRAACLLAANDTEGAAAELATADKLGARDEYIHRLTWRAIVNARLAKARNGDVRAVLQPIIARTAAAGYIIYELDAAHELAVLTGDAARKAAVVVRARKAGLLVFAR